MYSGRSDELSLVLVYRKRVSDFVSSKVIECGRFIQQRVSILAMSAKSTPPVALLNSGQSIPVKIRNLSNYKAEDEDKSYSFVNMGRIMDIDLT